MGRTMNFNAGPAALPLEALERAQRELIDFAGTGMSIIEHSHRGKAYESVHNEVVSLRGICSRFRTLTMSCCCRAEPVYSSQWCR